jgi:hypothetical protein
MPGYSDAEPAALVQWKRRRFLIRSRAFTDRIRSGQTAVARGLIFNAT